MKYYLIVKDFFKLYKLPCFSGIFLGCSFIPFPFFAWFFAFVPLWLFLYRQNSLKKILVACFLTQFISTFIGFNWIVYTVYVFAQMNWFFSFLILVLFCCFANSYILISGWIWFLLSKKNSIFSIKLILFPVLFSLFHSLIPTLFPWNMGYPWLWGGLWGMQTAELWGFRFLNTLFYIFNLLFLIVFYHIRKKSLDKNYQPAKSYFQKVKQKVSSYYLDSIALKALASAIFLFLFLNLLGLYLKQRLPEPDQKLKVIVVQHNLSALNKVSEHRIFFNLQRLTYRSLKTAFQEKKDLKSLKDIDLIVWPEGAYPYPLKKSNQTHSPMKDLIKKIKIPIVTGGTSITSEGQIQNSVFLFDREALLLKPIYSKIKLLIFGEYFPLIDKFPILRKLFPYFFSSMIPGKVLQAQELEGVLYAWPICYEILFDKLTRTFANQKAQVFVNFTIDSWYGFWQQPYQHLTMSFARAIELRRPLIRSTNTGFSGVILANGDIESISPLNKAWYALYEIPYYKKPLQTLFMSWGYFINEIFLSFLALFIAFLKFRKHFEISRTN
ncbi:MAG: apolipoprotein N-acyltransferase [Bdellovibrionales bacterium]|nr:apolipoprotein N-acyltransferase [Bdellovibrionales bacterium]